MDTFQIYILGGVAALATCWIVWFAKQRYQWFRSVINKNPIFATLQPVIAKSSQQKDLYEEGEPARLVAAKANFRQYIKYLILACLPYFWSTPIKLIQEFWTRQFDSKLTVNEKLQRMAKMILETSLILLFTEKLENGRYLFSCKNIRIPSKEHKEYHHINKVNIEIDLDESNELIVVSVCIDGEELINDIDASFAFLNTLWCVYTHTLTHIQAGNIAEINITNVKDRTDLPEEFKTSIDDMHSAVSGMNESANHYPADIWGIPRRNLQLVLGYNSYQQIHNHHTIVQCMKISNFVSFTMKARKVFAKHLSHTGLCISTLSANTIFHSIDHYNLDKYMVNERKEKSYLGIDSRLITTLLGKLNYDFGRWQGMRYTKYATWRAIYLELKEIDSYLADKVHMFVSV